MYILVLTPKILAVGSLVHEAVAEIESAIKDVIVPVCEKFNMTAYGFITNAQLRNCAFAKPLYQPFIPEGLSAINPGSRNTIYPVIFHRRRLTKRKVEHTSADVIAEIVKIKPQFEHMTGPATTKGPFVVYDPTKYYTDHLCTGLVPTDLAFHAKLSCCGTQMVSSITGTMAKAHKALNPAVNLERILVAETEKHEIIMQFPGSDPVSIHKLGVPPRKPSS